LVKQLGTTLAASRQKTLQVECLEILLELWNPNRSREVIHSSRELQELQVSRIVEIVDLSLLAKRPEFCAPLFDEILEKQPPTATTFPHIYEKIVPRIVQIKDFNVCEMPFSQFLEKLVIEYFQQVLGHKPAGIDSIRMRTIGCKKCAECHKVNDFVGGVVGNNIGDGTCLNLALNPQLVQHVCMYLDYAKDLVSYTVGPKRKRGNKGKIRSLDIVKTPIIRTATEWKDKVMKAENFLKQIGNDEVIRKLMGSNYRIVLEASMEGGTGTGMSAQVIDTSNGQRNTSGASLPAKPIVGTKRKATSG
jgi:hypothetical protein